MKKFFVLFTSVLIYAGVAQAQQTPNYVLAKIYAVAVSIKTDCSDPVLIFNEPSGVIVDMTQEPILGGGDPADGAYECVMIKMSDHLTFKVPATDGDCKAGEQYTVNVCNTNAGDSFQTMNIDGATVTFGAPVLCRGEVNDIGASYEDIVTIFLSTGSTDAVDPDEPFLRPTDPSKGIKLANAFKVEGPKTGTFVIDFTDKVKSDGGTCDVDPPIFSFR